MSSEEQPTIEPSHADHEVLRHSRWTVSYQLKSVVKYELLAFGALCASRQIALDIFESNVVPHFESAYPSPSRRTSFILTMMKGLGQVLTGYDAGSDLIKRSSASANDHYGRKPVIVFGLISCYLMAFFFIAIFPTKHMAMILCIMLGAGDAAMSAIYAAVADITVQQNQAIGFAGLFLISELGRIAANVLRSILRPLIGDTWSLWTYIPALIFVIDILFLSYARETNPDDIAIEITVQSQPDNVTSSHNQSANTVQIELTPLSNEQCPPPTASEDNEENVSALSRDDSEQQQLLNSEADANIPSPPLPSPRRTPSQNSNRGTLGTGVVFTALLCVALASSLLQLFPYMLQQWATDSIDSGGLGLAANESILVAIISSNSKLLAVGMVTAIAAFVWVMHSQGVLWTFITGLSSLAFAFLLLPFTHLAALMLSFETRDYVVNILLSVQDVIIYSGSWVSFLSGLLLVVNCSNRRMWGSLFGIVQTFDGAISFAAIYAGPALITTCASVGLPFPTPWLLMTLVCCVTVGIAHLGLPKIINRRLQISHNNAAP